MHIEIWSDFVCPFCYIGKRTLALALADFPQREQVKLTFKSFELDPRMKSDENKSIHDMLAEKFNTTVEQAKAMNEQVRQRAASVGLAFNFEHMKQTGTLDTHRLAKYANRLGKESEFVERMMRAHFTESAFLGHHDTLIKLAGEIGLDPNEVKQVLMTDDYLTEVRADEQKAREIGIQGVPFFLFNNAFAISGAQPLEVFQQALEKAWQDESV